MARKSTKKQPEAPKIDLGAEIFASLRELEKEKGIPVDYMVERMKQGMANAYRKDREDRRDVPADNVVVDLSENGLSMHIIKTAVANGKSLEDAESSFYSSFRNHAKNAYADGDLSRSEAERMLIQYGNREEDDAYWDLKEWDYFKQNGTTDGYSKYNNFYEAVRTGRNLKAVIKSLTL